MKATVGESQRTKPGEETQLPTVARHRNHWRKKRHPNGPLVNCCGLSKDIDDALAPLSYRTPLSICLCTAIVLEKDGVFCWFCWYQWNWSRPTFSLLTVKIYIHMYIYAGKSISCNKTIFISSGDTACHLRALHRNLGPLYKHSPWAPPWIQDYLFKYLCGPSSTSLPPSPTPLCPLHVFLL